MDKKNKKLLYHYLVGVGYNENGKYVDAIVEITPEEMGMGIIKDFLNKPFAKRSEIVGFKLRCRCAMLDIIHLKTKFKMDREMITTYVKNNKLKKERL